VGCLSIHTLSNLHHKQLPSFKNVSFSIFKYWSRTQGTVTHVIIRFVELEIFNAFRIQHLRRFV